MVRLQNGVLESWSEGKELHKNMTKKTLFLRVRILRPVLKLGRNYFHNLSMVNGSSYWRPLRTSDAKIKAVWTNCPTIFYSHVFCAVEQRGKSCTQFPLIFRSFLNEINVLIYHDVFVLDFLACVVIFGIQKPIWSAQTLFKKIISSYFRLNVWHS